MPTTIAGAFLKCKTEPPHRLEVMGPQARRARPAFPESRALRGDPLR